MKKITQIFLTMIMLVAFSAVNAQITIEGQFINGGSFVSVSYTDGLTTGSFVTDSVGYFSELTTFSGGQGGSIDLTFTGCNGSETVTNGWGGALTTVNFGNINYCPPTTFDASVAVQFDNMASGFTFELSWDNGATFSTETPMSNGSYSSILTGLSSGNTVLINYTDCSGNAQSLSDNFNSGFPDVNFGAEDACPAACNASFSFYQNFTQDSITQVITYSGPIIINNNSTSANPVNALTYTWDFGDGNSYTGANFTHVYAAVGTYTVTLSIDNGNGCTDSHDEVLTVDANGILAKANGGFSLQMGAGENSTDVASAINDLAKDVTVSVYPNPASSNINVALNSQINETVSLEIYNLTGKLVQQNSIEVSKGNQVVNVALNNLNKGLYIAQIKSIKGTLSTKLTIK